MFIYCNLALLMLLLTFISQVPTGESISGDVEVKPHSRPYMVLLERIMDNKAGEYCSGFLLSRDFVMTAAYCQAKSYKVFLGLHSVHDKHNLSLSVEEAFPHKDYYEGDFRNAIMILKLSSTVNVSNKVKPIALADHCGCSLPKSCSVSGWGGKDYFTKSATLREVSVALINNDLCAEKNLYCSDGENGPGLVDAGAPLVCEYGKVYGVAVGIIRKGTSNVYQYIQIKCKNQYNCV
uniref:trypsin n=1 Tax=Kryptolebias marmoratus TaxID=37003 RepID=A0A3Q3A5X9_KRYMA